MTVRREKVLVIGYGNPGRLDDGLGPALAEAVQKMNRTDVTVESDYQLVVEDAAVVAEHEVVIFADASVGGQAPFFFEKIEPSEHLEFTSHSLEPKSLMALAKRLFGATARGYALGIRGYHFNEFGQELSQAARENLDEAVKFLTHLFEMGGFENAAKKYQGHSIQGG